MCVCVCVCLWGSAGLHSCESMDDEWCILTLFATIFGTAAIKIYCVSFVIFDNFDNNDHDYCILTLVV